MRTFSRSSCASCPLTAWTMSTPPSATAASQRSRSLARSARISSGPRPGLRRARTQRRSCWRSSRPAGTTPRIPASWSRTSKTAWSSSPAAARRSRATTSSASSPRATAYPSTAGTARMPVPPCTPRRRTAGSTSPGPPPRAAPSRRPWRSSPTTGLLCCSILPRPSIPCRSA